MPNDELAEINGIKPNIFMADGEEKQVKSQTSASVYKVKRTWDHYYCTCPVWRNQGGVPVNARSCKHLKSLLGDKYEAARMKLRNPHRTQGTSKKKPESKTRTPAKRKRKDVDDEKDAKPVKRSRNPVSSGSKSSAHIDDDDEEEEEDDKGAESGPSGKKVPELLLANKWDIETGNDPTGWLMSEKLDGVRTFFDGKHMYSRLGNPFTPPAWFLDKLPKDITLDGELFGGRGKFQSTVSIVKTVNSPHWKGITFQVFDIPSRGVEPFEDRLQYLNKVFGPNGTHQSDEVNVVEHELVNSRQHVLDQLKKIESLGGEGLMLRKPGSQYEGCRSSTLLKIKTFYDAEAVVTGYTPGKDRNAGVTGALKCKMASGKAFSVGSGLSDQLRRKPPKIGAIITYRFQELTRDNVPRFPTYTGIAIDKDEPKDAEIPDHRKAGAKPNEDE
ncbi:DNA ligase/mRNA capping enzyme [Desarmillaria tabescens]|uniref:DNA ligase/mRNA capping enzyme n=1 Tax=Armillaria tabescens TaxID=1929756 RepID=A0AA39MRV6_ARMTA|nr:DNA ligase/mRNA capping enzyme [Desarmillaria tabescens]KAK0443958.1 DNA ligase/mRNA capping enzyme [Desarmillaria tabescens]